MNRDEFVKAATDIYGPKGWQSLLATDLAVDGSSVRRWTSGAVPVPGAVAAFITVKVENKKLQSRVDRLRKRA